MENRSGTPFCPPKRPVHSVSLFYFQICIFLLAAGCGAPGEPQPPTPPVPQAIADLTAKQAGDGVLLTFTMTGEEHARRKVAAGAHVRSLARNSAARWHAGSQIVSSGGYRARDAGGPLIRSSGQVQFIDPVSPTDPQLRSGQPFVLSRTHTFFTQAGPLIDSKEMTLPPLSPSPNEFLRWTQA